MKDQAKDIIKFGLAAALALVIFPGVQAYGSGARSAVQSAQEQQSKQPPQQTGEAQQNQPAQPGQSSSGQPAPSLRNPQAAPASQPAISPEESEAYKAIAQELDPAKQLSLIKNFEKQFPNSSLLSDVYFFGANAEEQENDAPNALIYGQKSLKLKPDNLRSLILVAGLLPLPQTLQGTTDQKVQQLSVSEDDANRALQLLAHLPPPSAETADQFKVGKQLIVAQVHAALGMAHLQKALIGPSTATSSELTMAEQEFKSAVACPQPNPQDYYRLGEVYTRENRLDDAIGAFTQSAQLGQGKLIEKFANDMIQKLKAFQAKQGSAPATGSAAAPAKK